MILVCEMDIKVVILIIIDFVFAVPWLLCSFIGCMDGVINSSSECEIGKLSFNSSQICYIHLCTNIFGKGVNPSPPPNMVK